MSLPYQVVNSLIERIVYYPTLFSQVFFFFVQMWYITNIQELLNFRVFVEQMWAEHDINV